MPAPASTNVLDAVADGVLVVGQDGRVIFANRAAGALAESWPQDLVGRSTRSILRPLDAGPHRLALLHRQHHPPLLITLVVRPLGDGRRTVITMSQPAPRQRPELALAYHALHDPLTGLPNRLLLEDRFKQAARAARRSGLPFAVAMLDLDRFKDINDQFGHTAGDDVLRQVARRLTTAMRQVDTVARFGGDEFVLLAGLERGEHGQRVATRALQAVAQPLVAAGRAVQVLASVGVAIFPVDGTDLPGLLERADHAMYQAKRNGGGCHMWKSAPPPEASHAVGEAPRIVAPVEPPSGQPSP